MKKALIALSGGLDSATVAAIAKNENYHLTALSFDYGQTHKIELESVKKLLSFLILANIKSLKLILIFFKILL